MNMNIIKLVVFLFNLETGTIMAERDWIHTKIMEFVPHIPPQPSCVLRKKKEMLQTEKACALSCMLFYTLVFIEIVFRGEYFKEFSQTRLLGALWAIAPLSPRPLITHRQTWMCVNMTVCVAPFKPVALPLTFNRQHQDDKHILATLAQNSTYWNIPTIEGSNPKFNFSHFALLHLWLEWIMIISWLWFGRCLWAWGHSSSELL